MSYDPFPYKRAVDPTAAQQRYLDWILEQPCLVTGRYGVTKHHVTASRDGGRFTRSHWIAAPLIRELHLIQDGPEESVEALGHAKFYERYGVDLEVAAFHTLVRYLETEAFTKGAGGKLNKLPGGF
jgi:hypothetical protein